MEHLTTAEKQIIDYLCESEILDDKEQLEQAIGGSKQYNEGSFQHMILIVFRNDALLKGVGIEIDFDLEDNEQTIFITEPENAELPILRDYVAFQRVNYYLLKVPKFMSELEKSGFIDKISMGNPFKRNRNNLPLLINSQTVFHKTLEVKDKSLKKDFFDCFNYYYVPTLKLREYKKYNYKTADILLSERESLIAKQNIKIAKSGLIISVISAICSLIAILITMFNSGEATTVKFDKDQMNSIRELVQKEKNNLQTIDTTVKK
jgi:hypothetical protein